MATVLVAPPVRNHSVTLLVLHVVWSTSRRSPMLEPAIDGPLAALLRRKASELQCCLLGVGVASDHVHIVVLATSPRAPEVHGDDANADSSRRNAHSTTHAV
jgi:REP element-mobilizing transposase RayT